jgi:hypothetical protein
MPFFIKITQDLPEQTGKLINLNHDIKLQSSELNLGSVEYGDNDRIQLLPNTEE